MRPRWLILAALMVLMIQGCSSAPRASADRYLRTLQAKDAGQLLAPPADPDMENMSETQLREWLTRYRALIDHELEKIRATRMVYTTQEDGTTLTLREDPIHGWKVVQGPLWYVHGKSPQAALLYLIKIVQLKQWAFLPEAVRLQETGSEDILRRYLTDRLELLRATLQANQLEIKGGEAAAWAPGQTRSRIQFERDDKGRWRVVDID